MQTLDILVDGPQADLIRTEATALRAESGLVPGHEGAQVASALRQSEDAPVPTASYPTIACQSLSKNGPGQNSIHAVSLAVHVVWVRRDTVSYHLS